MMPQDEELMGAASPAPSDHKRKHEDLEPDALEPPQFAAGLNGNPESESESESLKKAEGVEEDDSEAKRPRLEDKLGVQATENGYQEEKAYETEVDAQPSVDSNTPLEDAPQLTEVALEKVKDGELAADDHQDEGMQQPSGENIQLENAQEEPSRGELLGPPEELQEPPANVPQQGDVSSAEQKDTFDGKTVTRKMEVPNTKVGVLIGKAGDTIRYLQFNSGARIQITRDAEADPHSGTRPVELIGTLENINKAEKLIKDVIAEADAGGSPSLVARGFSTVQAAGAGEQIQIQVPNEKVGLIIGKGGETIKNLQTRSGARIQLIPQHLPKGDQSKERTVRVTGDKKKIEMAREMIKEVMDQPVRPSPISSGFNQQAFRPHGTAASQWGPLGPHPAHQTGYDYQQRGPYQSQNPQYAPQAYGNYPPQQPAPRSNFGWEQRHPTTMQGPPPHGGYDYYGRQGGHAADASNHTHAPGPSLAMGPPTSQSNYTHGQPQGPDYGQPAPYSQTAPPAQGYGHGYNETKYESQGAIQNPYGGNGAVQQAAYPKGTTQSGYGWQEHYGKPQSYGTPPQGPYAQPCGQPRATQPGYVSYQGPISLTQSYGLPASAQQPHPYGSSGQTQQNYPPYGSAPSADGYNHPAPAMASAPGYPQQVGQPVSGHGQPGGQQAPGYAQYPASQPVYTEQAATNNAVYGYQGTADPAYNTGPGAAYVAPPSGQPAYTQVPPTQEGYDQSVPQSGGYATVPAGYGKSLSPQLVCPQYDTSQMYGAQR